MKEAFYPREEKSTFFAKGYIALASGIAEAARWI